MKYVLEDGEHQIMKGYVTPPKRNSFLRHEQGLLYLTNRRLVYTSSTGIVGALIGNLVDAFLPQMQNIVYQISLKDIKQVKKEKQTKMGIVGFLLLITIKSGEEFYFRVYSNSGGMTPLSEQAKERSVEIWRENISIACREIGNDITEN